MNNTPTPRTDFAIKASNGQWNFVLRLCSERLERELTAAREEIKETQKHLKDANRGAEINAHALRINADKLIAVTEQRDRLAEALREVATYDPSDGQCNSGYSCKYIAEQALQSLNQAAVKGRAMRYEVKAIQDYCECEDCGASYAEGFEIYRDGELVHTMKPVAHCFDDDNYKPEDWAVWIIRDLGSEVWIDGWEAAKNETTIVKGVSNGTHA